MKKDYQGFVSHEEFVKRLNVVHADLDGKLSERPTSKQIKSTLQVLEDRYDALSKNTHDQLA